MAELNALGNLMYGECAHCLTWIEKQPPSGILAQVMSAAAAMPRG
jgi:hypothetical protein